MMQIHFTKINIFLMSLITPKPHYDENRNRRVSKYSPDQPPNKEDNEMEPIYEIQEIYTQEIMLPYATNDHIQFLQRNKSDFIRDKDRNRQYAQSPYDISSPLGSYQFLNESNKKQFIKHPNFTREGIHEMNKKHRNIRTSQYKKSNHGQKDQILNLYEDLSAQRPILTAREVHLSHQKIFTRKHVMSSSTQRAVSNLMRNSGQLGETPKRASSTQGVRREASRIAFSNEKIRTYQLRKHNPLVIYPFESKLKLKRIDDNPKILGNIIRKKFKQMQKEDLYLYINGIVHRQDK